MTKIALTLIVKNEAHVITRCLDSAKAIADYVYVSDTGSTDGTQEIIRHWLYINNIPGMVTENKWVNFAVNRSNVTKDMKVVAPDIDYCFMIDADEIMNIKEGVDIDEFKNSLTADAYHVTAVYEPLRYTRIYLFSNKKPFIYKSVVHEFVDCNELHNLGTVDPDSIFITTRQDGAASIDCTNKWKGHIALMSAALKTEKDPLLISRYHFYLAESYKRDGNINKAIKHYNIRTKLGFWDQERYIAYVYMARLKEIAKEPLTNIMKDYLAAIELAPTRLEVYRDIVKLLTLHCKYQQAYIYGKHALSLITNYPPNGLFVDLDVWSWSLIDEFSVCAYYAGYIDEAKELYLKLLEVDSALPSAHRNRIITNLSFCNNI